MPEFICYYCEKAYPSKFGRDRHIDRKHKIQSRARTRALTCSFCKKTLSRVDNLKTHIKTCKQNPDRYNGLAWSCNVCNRSFAFQSLLKQHQLSHESEICEYCNETFKKSYIHKHVLRCNGQVNRRGIASKLSDTVVNTLKTRVNSQVNETGKLLYLPQVRSILYKILDPTHEDSYGNNENENNENENNENENIVSEPLTPGDSLVLAKLKKAEDAGKPRKNQTLIKTICVNNDIQVRSSIPDPQNPIYVPRSDSIDPTNDYVALMNNNDANYLTNRLSEDRQTILNQTLLHKKKKKKKTKRVEPGVVPTNNKCFNAKSYNKEKTRILTEKEKSKAKKKAKKKPTNKTRNTKTKSKKKSNVKKISKTNAKRTQATHHKSSRRLSRGRGSRTCRSKGRITILSSNNYNDINSSSEYDPSNDECTSNSEQINDNHNQNNNEIVMTKTKHNDENAQHNTNQNKNDCDNQTSDNDIDEMNNQNDTQSLDLSLLEAFKSKTFDEIMQYYQRNNQSDSEQDDNHENDNSMQVDTSYFEIFNRLHQMENDTNDNSADKTSTTNENAHNNEAENMELSDNDDERMSAHGNGKDEITDSEDD